MTQLTRLVNDLLDVSRLSNIGIPLLMNTASLTQVVQFALDVATPGIEARSQRLKIVMQESDAILFCDQTRISQVIGNVLINASKYTDMGGAITLTVSTQDKQLNIQVEDNGLGIPSDKLETIFDLYTQIDGHAYRARGGMGIGLSLVKNFVEQHGGTVSAESAGAGQGSLFRISLPIVNPAN